MPAGLLEITGTIDLKQFWPPGTADADTTKIKVTVGASAFQFRPNPAAAFAVTHVFDKAKVKGKVTKPAIDNDQRVTIRLQSIDAPELHYRPSAALKVKQQSAQQRKLYLQWNLEYRQRLAETATVELRKFLSGGGHDPLPCVVRTAIDKPDDAFDTYGRLVGDIYVQIAGKEVDVNLWLVEKGWALPAFYNSMEEDEITRFYAAGRLAAKAKAAVWGVYEKSIGKLDWTLVFARKKAAPDPKDNSKPVIMPKVFRRLSTWEVNKRAKMVQGTFESYLVKQRDYCHLRADFLDQGPAADVRSLDEFVNKGQLTVSPDDLVFREKPSKLIVPGGGTPTW
jgi:endonuclease YncB( thermonuclease family)